MAACGGGDGDAENSASAQSERADIRIEFTMIGEAGNPFYNVIKNGARQAGEDLGVDVQYNETGSVDFQEQARLIRSAIAREPDGLVVADYSPDVIIPPVQEAVDAGIPVMFTNSVGKDTVEETGALGFVGQDEFEVGRVAGERLRESGTTSVLCLNQSPGSVPLEARCDGLASVFGGDNTNVVPVDYANRTAARNAIASVIQDTDADAMLALGITSAEPALQALEESDQQNKIKLGAIDLSPTVLQAITEGEILFTSDQQQYLQGYLPVVMLTLQSQYGMMPPPLLSTGPSYVTEENAEDVMALSDEGIR